MDAKISSDVEVWDKNGDPVFYDDLDDLTSKLQDMLTPDCKLLPTFEFRSMSGLTIVKMRITDNKTEICPKCNKEVDPTTIEPCSWHGVDRYLHSECMDQIIETATEQITRSL